MKVQYYAILFLMSLAFVFSLLPFKFFACNDVDEASEASPLEPVFEVT